MSLARASLGLGAVAVAHEVDHALDRRHAGQVADHDLLGRRLHEVVDRPARAVVHAPRHLLGEAEQAVAAVDLGELQRLGAQHLLHVVLHRRGGDHEHRREQHAGRHHEQAGIDQGQPEGGRAQDPGERPNPMYG